MKIMHAHAFRADGIEDYERTRHSLVRCCIAGPQEINEKALHAASQDLPVRMNMSRHRHAADKQLQADGVDRHLYLARICVFSVNDIGSPRHVPERFAVACRGHALTKYHIKTIVSFSRLQDIILHSM